MGRAHGGSARGRGGRPAANTYLEPNHDKRLRDAIKAGDIIDRFQRFVLGDPTVELSREQVRAGTVLLHKVLPDMAPVDTNGNATPIKIEIVRFGGDRQIVVGEPPMIDATPIAEGEKVN